VASQDQRRIGFLFLILLPLTLVSPTLHAAFVRFAGLASLVALVFFPSLWDLIRLSGTDDLFSHLPFVPLVCLILAWVARERMDAPLRGAGIPAGGTAFVSVVLTVASWSLPHDSPEPALPLVLRGAALVAGIWTAGFLAFGMEVTKSLRFPFLFLVFLIPMPRGTEHVIAGFLQHGSATAAGWLFALLGIPHSAHDLVFHLPNINLRVAPECSGIRSTLVLFMTSLVVGHLLLEKGWQRFLLTAMVIPLGIARNALRIASIGWLCTNLGPDMIHSAIHRRGGPLFFALSLIPLVVAVLWMQRSNRKSE
jgi:exosortase C (VPDSG-CTERM-specific)